MSEFSQILVTMN